MRNPLRRKKKPEQTYKGPHEVTKIDFPIKAPVMTYNFGDLLRYFKYYMGSGLIDSHIERRVQRELINKSAFPTRLVFGSIGIGIMCFMIFLGAYILINSPGVAAPALPATAPALVG